MQISVRTTIPDDAAGWVECHLTAMAATYPAMPAEFIASRRARQEELAAEVAREIAVAVDGELHLVATADDAIVGIAHRRLGPATWELSIGPEPWDLPQLTTLYLLPAVQGRGLGSELMTTILEPGPAYLWVMDENPGARDFYGRHGFVAEDRGWSSGPTWFHHRMRRMRRHGSGATASPATRS